jgi:hypothetical protein
MITPHKIHWVKGARVIKTFKIPKKSLQVLVGVEAEALADHLVML